MTEQPVVSVVIPAHNAAATIGRAIASVLDQDYPAIEVVVVDDCSADGTAEEAKRAGGDRVRVVTPEVNLGAAGARNLGVRSAQGRYVAFLDADDAWRPRKLARQVALAEADAAVTLVHCNGEHVDPSGAVRDRVFDDEPAQGAEAWRAMLRSAAVHTSCVLARRDLVLELGGFDTGLVVAEDQDLWIRLALRGRVAVVPDILVTIHVTPGSLMAREEKRHAGFLLPMIERHVAAQRDRLSKAEVAAILRQRYLACGRNAYAAGAVGEGLRLLLGAAAHGASLLSLAPFLIKASPPARWCKRVLLGRT
jgi:glycosyltransferase involved in cell wall biosynthesis